MRKMRAPKAPGSHKFLVIGGLLLFVLGSWFLWSAWEANGKGTPFPLGVLTPF